MEEPNLSYVIKQNESEVEKYDFCFLAFSVRVLFRLWFGENTTEIWQLVPKIQIVEGLNNNKKQKKLLALRGCILKQYLRVPTCFK